MFCPQCKVEYRRGFSICADCQVALVPELPSEPEAPPAGTPDPHMELVTVWRTGNPVALAVAKSVLEDADVPYAVLGDSTVRMRGGLGALFGADPMRGHYAIQVAASDADETRELLSELEEDGI